MWVGRNRYREIRTSPMKRVDRPWSLSRPSPGRSPRLIFLVVGQSRDDALTAVRRREAIIPARSLLS
jgi:hypothetical protein